MADDFGLLFEPVPAERAAFDQLVVVTAKGVPHEREVPASARLGLPHMGHFVDEQPLERQILPGEVFRPQTAVRMEVDIA